MCATPLIAEPDPAILSEMSATVRKITSPANATTKL